MNNDHESIFVRNEKDHVLEFNTDGVLNEMYLYADTDYYEIIGIEKSRLKVQKLVSNEVSFFTMYDIIFELDNIAFVDKRYDNLYQDVSFSETYNELTLSLYEMDEDGNNNFQSAISYDLIKYDIPKY